MTPPFDRLDRSATASAAEALVDRVIVPHPSEQIVGWVPIADSAPNEPGCARCPYELEAHLDGACPSEAEARAAFGDR